MTTATINCPRCGSNLCRGHCPSPTCDLVRCVRCDGIGTRDGKRWRNRRDNEPK